MTQINRARCKDVLNNYKVGDYIKSYLMEIVENPTNTPSELNYIDAINQRDMTKNIDGIMLYISNQVDHPDMTLRDIITTVTLNPTNAQEECIAWLEINAKQIYRRSVQLLEIHYLGEEAQEVFDIVIDDRPYKLPLVNLLKVWSGL